MVEAPAADSAAAVSAEDCAVAAVLVAVHVAVADAVDADCRRVLTV